MPCSFIIYPILEALRQQQAQKGGVESVLFASFPSLESPHHSTHIKEPKDLGRFK